MKVEVDIGREKFVIDVDGFQVDVYRDLENEMTDDPVKKSAWLSGVAYEVERRYSRFVSVEKGAYMMHWKLWAARWLKAKDIRDTADNISTAIAKIFSDAPVDEKVKFLYSVLRLVPPSRRFERWEEFYHDESISSHIKDECSEMFKLEMEHNMTFDKALDRESRMLSIVKSLKAASDAYKEKMYQEGRMAKLA